jgi:hypothetical protein
MIVIYDHKFLRVQATDVLLQNRKIPIFEIVMQNNLGRISPVLMEQRALSNANKCLNTNIYSYLVTSGGQSSNL